MNIPSGLSNFTPFQQICLHESLPVHFNRPAAIKLVLILEQLVCAFGNLDLTGDAIGDARIHPFLFRTHDKGINAHKTARHAPKPDTPKEVLFFKI